jgi:hypothetical protein
MGPNYFSIFSNGSYLGLRPGSSNTKRTTWRPFHHSLGPIDPTVSKKIIFRWFVVEWSLGYPLSEFCPTAPVASQVVRITKNRKFAKKSHKNDLLWNLWVKWAQTMVKWSLGYPLSEFCPMAPATSQVVRNTKNSKFGKKSFKNQIRWHTTER